MTCLLLCLCEKLMMNGMGRYKVAGDGWLWEADNKVHLNWLLSYGNWRDDLRLHVPWLVVLIWLLFVGPT